MKKSHEYDSPVLSRLVSVVTVLAICVCSVCSIVTASKIATLSTTTVSVNSGDSQPSNSNSNGASSNNTGSSGTSTQTPANSDGSASSGDGSDNAGTPAASSYTNEEILAKYSEVLDNLKANVATYDKKEFQTLAEDRNLGTVGNLILPIAENIMTSEDKAEVQHRDDAVQIPVIGNTKGCLLTDTSAIKSATMTEDGGKTTIVIVLNDEDNPEPASEGAATSPSLTGAMFNPLSKSSVDDIASKFSAVATINSFNLRYTDCTATLIFDTETNQVESFQQIMNVYITVDAKVTLFTISGYATLINNMLINNIQYK